VSDDLKEACVECQLKAKKLVKDVTTRWNSTTNTIHRAVELWAPVEIVAVKPIYNKPRGIQLKKWLPSRTEWGLLEALIPMLDVRCAPDHMACPDVLLKAILYSTTVVSESKKALVHHVIPLIDMLTTTFDKVIDDESEHMVIRHAALRGLLMLNKYYARTDDSLVYRFAMSKLSSMSACVS
jgi:hypothetical protein